LSEAKYKNALDQLEEFKRVDCDNSELIGKLLNIAPDPGKIVCSLHRSKTPRYFLLYLAHTEVSFTLVAGIGNAFIGHKSQHFIFVVDPLIF
jgi:hypothetical protein